MMRDLFFEGLLKRTKREMKSFLYNFLKNYYTEIISGNGFLYAKGKEPVCLLAHMDTTPMTERGARIPVQEICYTEMENGDTKIMSPQGIGGDDRCGIWIILHVLTETEYRPTIVFCEDEEIGCVGSGKFARTEFVYDLSNMKYLVQLDRRGKSDAVYYEDENESFHRYITETINFPEQYGTYTDICEICPVCGIAGVNLSVGYYNEHHTYEEIHYKEMIHTFDCVKVLLKELKDAPVFEYVDSYGSDFSWGVQEKENRNLCVMLNNGQTLLTQGETYEEAMYNFFIGHPTICANDIYGIYET